MAMGLGHKAPERRIAPLLLVDALHLLHHRLNGAMPRSKSIANTRHGWRLIHKEPFGASCDTGEYSRTMSRALDDLVPEMRSKAFELIARCCEAGIPVMIIDTLRTEAEQRQYVARGVSWTLNSKHLTGHAIDLCPYAQFELHGPDRLAWNTDEPAWQVIGEIGEQLGLTWGGRWNRTPDYGHFELNDRGGATRPKATSA
jgi:peptidoglycan L-alanyl-D-glutamate endopeptidase CwlK